MFACGDGEWGRRGYPHPKTNKGGGTEERQTSLHLRGVIVRTIGKKKGGKSNWFDRYPILKEGGGDEKRHFFLQKVIGEGQPSHHKNRGMVLSGDIAMKQ